MHFFAPAEGVSHPVMKLYLFVGLEGSLQIGSEKSALQLSISPCIMHTPKDVEEQSIFGSWHWAPKADVHFVDSQKIERLVSQDDKRFVCSFCRRHVFDNAVRV